MLFESLLQEYGEVINLFYKEYPRRKNKKQKVHIDDKLQVIVLIIAIIGLTIYYSYRVYSYLNNGKIVGVFGIICIAMIATWMILDGRLWIKSSNALKEDQEHYKKRLEKVYDLLSSCGISTRNQIEDLCIKAKQYKPNALKAVLTYKKVLVFTLLQAGIPLVFFALDYVAAQEKYQTDIGMLLGLIVTSTLILVIFYSLLVMTFPAAKDIFAKKLSLAEDLAEDLELLLIFYSMNQQLIEPGGNKGTEHSKIEVVKPLNRCRTPK